MAGPCVHWSVGHPTFVRSTGRSVGRLVNQKVGQLVGWWVGQLVGWSVGLSQRRLPVLLWCVRAFGLSVCCSAALLLDRSVCRSVGPLVGLSVRLSGRCFVGCRSLVGQSVGRLDEWSVSQSIGRLLGRSIGLSVRRWSAVVCWQVDRSDDRSVDLVDWSVVSRLWFRHRSIS